MYGEGRWRIKEGLEEGDIVVNRGNIRISAGQTLTVDTLKDA